MRTKLIFKLLVICISLLIFQACQKDSDNPTSSSNLSGKGTDYLPISSGKLLSAKVSGTTSDYDSLGNVTDFTQVNNQTYTCSIGASTVIRNMISYPIYYYNNNNRSTLGGYLSNDNDEIIGFTKSYNDPEGIILPSELTIGKEWIVNPQSPPAKQIKAKYLESFDSFTNSTGNSYKNVINIHIAFIDSTNSKNYFSNGYNITYLKTIIDANIYLAQGIGIIGAKLNNSEQISKTNYKWGTYTYNYYKRQITTGTVGAIN